MIPRVSLVDESSIHNHSWIELSCYDHLPRYWSKCTICNFGTLRFPIGIWNSPVDGLFLFDWIDVLVHRVSVSQSSCPLKVCFYHELLQIIDLFTASTHHHIQRRHQLSRRLKLRQIGLVDITAQLVLIRNNCLEVVFVSGVLQIRTYKLFLFTRWVALAGLRWVKVVRVLLELWVLDRLCRFWWGYWLVG